MFKSKLISLAVGTMVMAMASLAQAGPISLMGTGLGTAVTISHNGSDVQVLAGEIVVDYGASGLTAYCVDLDHDMESNWIALTAPVSTVNGGLAIAYLYDHFASAVTTATQAAGLQIAIWEVLDDFGGSLDLSSGNFRLSGPSPLLTAAQGFIDALPTCVTSYTTPSYILKSGSDPQAQDLIVPEPASLVLLACALPVLLTGLRR
jgi:hypothetical protein